MERELWATIPCTLYTLTVCTGVVPLYAQMRSVPFAFKDLPNPTISNFEMNSSGLVMVLRLTTVTVSVSIEDESPSPPTLFLMLALSGSPVFSLQ